MEACLYLFVPATRLDRVAKAFDSGADEVIIDLEDAVADHLKDAIRDELLALDGTIAQSYWLRVNGGEGLALDMALIGQLKRIKGIFLPKCQTPQQVEDLFAAFGLPIVAMIETPQGVANIAQIARAKGLMALSFGRLDLMNSLGVRLGSPACEGLFDKIRADLLVHSLACGLRPPLETVFTDLTDDAGLIDCVRHWSDFGFGGQLAIHPKQLPIMRQALAMGEDEHQFAQKIWQTYTDTAQTIFAVDGHMVDLPLIVWAARRLGESMA